MLIFRASYFIFCYHIYDNKKGRNIYVKNFGDYTRI